jgi:hypothetical protein
VKTNVIPVIIGKTETTSKSFKKFLSNTPEKARYQETIKKQPFLEQHTYFGK